MNNQLQLTKLSLPIFFLILLTTYGYAQPSCSGTVATGEYCVLYTGRTIIEDNNNRVPLYMEYNEGALPQGPYNIRINGIDFTNEYFFSYDAICCKFGNISDFGFDMDMPGTYTFVVESIESLANECVANFNSPISVSNITVLPKPLFDISFMCLPNGDTQIDVILMSNLPVYTYLSLHGLPAPLPQVHDPGQFSMGDTVLTTIKTLQQGITYQLELRDCNVETLLQREDYTHNCSSCIDTSSPIANCKDLSIDLQSNVIHLSPTDLDNNSTDDCGIVSYGINFDEFDCSHIGQRQAILTVSDGAGNSSKCTSLLTITDQQNTCNQCTIYPQPIIELAYTESVGSLTRIWFELKNSADYAPILNRISTSKIGTLIENGSGLFSNSSLSTTFQLTASQFFYLDVNFNSQFINCPLHFAQLVFHDNLCDVTYKSNSIEILCDNDNDGFLITEDCNDNNDTQYPGAFELCDGIDNNCDGIIGEEVIDIFGFCCPYLLDVNQSTIISGTYSADYTVTAEGMVSKDSTVYLKAGNNVNLAPGFEVKSGAVMHAFIAPCQ